MANLLGYDILHLPTDPQSRKRLDLFRSHQINLILDIGANIGQYATSLRNLGYKGRIVSFEPLSSAYSELEKKAINDPLWQAVHLGLGDSPGKMEIHIAQNSYSSSLLDMLPEHLASAPDAMYVGSETITINTIDNIIYHYHTKDDHCFVKIDAQGYETKILDGCRQSFNKILGFQLELSLKALYKDEALMPDMLARMNNLGYSLKHIETGHMNYETGEILQLEGFFFR
jgi:FkbM family methyltransferase